MRPVQWACSTLCILDRKRPDELPYARRDRLAEGFRSFGIGVVVMDRHDTPVPHGCFYCTAMLQNAGEIAMAVVTRQTLFAGFSVLSVCFSFSVLPTKN